ncbi:MAG TPA: hypothetical protein PLS53_15920 [Thermoanaerobaculaceae bacterium]|nr:hypothetical protein [Thermoanaerobaculaceae bacterium]
MHKGSTPAAWVILTALLAGVLYPALALHHVVAPEASLRGQAPWRVQWGPFPSPAPEQVRAATELGSRLTLLGHGLSGLAVWNPGIGGGRPGWLASPREGGAPLPLLAVLLARSGHAWTGLVAIEIAAAFLACAWMLRRMQVEPCSAAVGALCYALSGPVASHLLDWQGSALALGPLAIAAAIGGCERGFSRSLARWAVVLAVVVSCGPPAAPFVALAAVVAVWQERWARSSRALAMLLLGGIVAVAVLTPRWWLAVVGREAGAPAVSPTPEPRLPGLASLALEPQPLDPAAPPAAQPASDGRGFIGLGPLLLAAIGLGFSTSRLRAAWAGALLVALGMVLAPDAWLGKIGFSHRPLGLVTLGIATLAALGVQRLLGGMKEPRRSLAALAVAGLLAWSLLPVAARHVPYATAAEAALPVPLSPAASPASPRAVGLLGCLPPDLGAAAGLQDARAGFFDGETRYTTLLGAGPGGAVSISRALTPAFALLGVRTLIEPLPARVVSGEIFSRVEIVDIVGAGDASGMRHYPLNLYPGACRLGLPAPLGLKERPWLRIGHALPQLQTDPALSNETDAWSWFALPTIGTQVRSELVLAAGAPEALSVALDQSGLRLVSESAGMRVWDWERSVPFASLAWPLGDARAATELCPGVVKVREASADRLVLDVANSDSCSVQVQVKHRPRLWQAKVDGQTAQLLPCAEVWSCVPVRRGAATLELAASLPWTVKALSMAGLSLIIGLAWVGRKT